MEPHVIEFLPIEEMRIVKQIIVMTHSNDRDISLGYILYERKFTEEYKLKETPEEERDFSYYLEYPKQDTFPNDNIDDLILQAFRNQYPKSILRNHSVLCNIDVRNIETLKNRPVEQFFLEITPDFSGTDIYSLAGKSFDIYQKEINLYADFKIGTINRVFGYYDLNDRNIIERIRTVNFI